MSFFIKKNYEDFGFSFFFLTKNQNPFSKTQGVLKGIPKVLLWE